MYLFCKQIDLILSLVMITKTNNNCISLTSDSPFFLLLTNTPVIFRGKIKTERINEDTYRFKRFEILDNSEITD